MSTGAITFDNVLEAAERIRSDVVRTPILSSPALDAVAGGRVFVKADNLQHTGSFKFRGAINRIRALDEDARRRGVVAFSSGNHALAVSEAARRVGTPATVIMPADAPAMKVAGARARRARVILYDREREDRERIGARLVEAEGLTLISPFDDPHVIAGQGTGALEAVEQVRAETGLAPDQAVVCCSGGGLAAGWAIALDVLAPEARVVTAEPAAFDDMARSLASGQWERNAHLSGSVCDALLMPSPGRMTLPVLLALKARGVAVSDAEVLAAMAFAACELKLILEPGGAAALAAVLARAVEGSGRTTLIIASGGNADPAMIQSALARAVAA